MRGKNKKKKTTITTRNKEIEEFRRINGRMRALIKAKKKWKIGTVN